MSTPVVWAVESRNPYPPTPTRRNGNGNGDVTPRWFRRWDPVIRGLGGWVIGSSLLSADLLHDWAVTYEALPAYGFFFGLPWAASLLGKRNQ